MHDPLSRRNWMLRLSGIGIGGLTFQRALAQEASLIGKVTREMVHDAAWIAGIELTEDEQVKLAHELNTNLQAEQKLRDYKLDADTGPAMVFLPYFFAENVSAPASDVKDSIKAIHRFRPLIGNVNKQSTEVDWNDPEQLAGTSIKQQYQALREKKVTSTRLTDVYLDRIKRFDPLLRCVVTLCENRAREQAAQADQELASGIDRGYLHGIPWGAKDLIAVPPYKTTWGAGPYKDQVRQIQATVANRLDRAGAVMLAKLSLGTLAWGDIWYDATTKNPWNTDQGSSGSSAGSCSAVAAGLCSFALGSETLGSVVSPSRRCRVTGLRPSFGRVSRFGCMPLAWSMDKIGTIARTAEDCGLVLSAIQGTDRRDPTVVDRPLEWPTNFAVHRLKIGVIESDISENEKWVCEWFKEEGATIVPIRFPNEIPLDSLKIGLSVESGAMFDELLRSGVPDTEMGLWGPSFRASQFARGIHYVQSMRARSLLILETEQVLNSVDVLLGGDDLLRTNLTGHPSMVATFATEKQTRGKEDSVTWMPRTIKMTAGFFRDPMLVAVGDALQRAKPPMPKLPSLPND